jgi:dTDP-4-dehydrorhamnose reductase
MQSTVVIGATGFLGAHVAAAAFARAREVATLAEPYGPPVYGVGRDPDAAPRFCDPRDGIEWVARDLAPAGAAAALLDELEATEVISCAALARLDDCEREPARARRVNAELPGELAAWCAARAARLVQVSTDLVFGRVAPPPAGFGERDEPAPVSTYGETKAAGERATLAAYPAALVVRLPLLYGNSGGRGLGASDWLLEAVERDERPALFVDEWRTPLEVTNAAEALVELLEHDARGLLHVAGPERISRYELGLATLGAMGLERAEAEGFVRAALRADAPASAARPADVALDGRRARGLLATPLLGVAAGTRAAVR